MPKPTVIDLAKETAQLNELRLSDTSLTLWLTDTTTQAEGGQLENIPELDNLVRRHHVGTHRFRHADTPRLAAPRHPISTKRD